MYAQKTRIVMQGRVRFAGAVVRKDWLDATMWLKRRITHQRLVRTESFRHLGYGHHFQLRDPADVDASIVKLLREAFAIGQQLRFAEAVPTRRGGAAESNDERGHHSYLRFIDLLNADVKSIILNLVLIVLIVLVSLPLLALYVFVFFGIGGGWTYAGTNGCHFVLRPIGYAMLVVPALGLCGVTWGSIRKLRRRS